MWPSLRTIVVHLVARQRPAAHLRHARAHSSATSATGASETPTTRAYKVLFFGSDHFSIPSLQALHANSRQTRPERLDNPVAELAVVTSFAGTDNAVRKYVKATGLPAHSWPLAAGDGDGGDGGVALCRLFDVGVVVSFGHLIPEPLIDAFPLGMINVHASLLPRWRGAAPIIHALRAGDRETGVTVMRIRPQRFDVGEVLAQRRVPIGAHTLMPELHAQLAQCGAAELVAQMRRLERSLAEARAQDESSVAYAPKVTDDLALVDWQRMSAQQVYNLYRALYSFKRLQTSWLGQHTVRIVELRPTDAATAPEGPAIHRPPGSVEYCRRTRELRVWCADARTVSVLRLSVAGKRTFTASEFSNGYMRQLAGAVRPQFL